MSLRLVSTIATRCHSVHCFLFVLSEHVRVEAFLSPVLTHKVPNPKTVIYNFPGLMWGNPNLVLNHLQI